MFHSFLKARLSRRMDAFAQTDLSTQSEEDRYCGRDRAQARGADAHVAQSPLDSVMQSGRLTRQLRASGVCACASGLRVRGSLPAFSFSPRLCRPQACPHLFSCTLDRASPEPTPSPAVCAAVSRGGTDAPFSPWVRGPRGNALLRLVLRSAHGCRVRCCCSPCPRVNGMLLSPRRTTDEKVAARKPSALHAARRRMVVSMPDLQDIASPELLPRNASLRSAGPLDHQSGSAGDAA